MTILQTFNLYKDIQYSVYPFLFIGLDLGILVAFVSSGYLCTIRLDNGWPFIFYTYGTSNTCTYTNDVSQVETPIHRKTQQQQQQQKPKE